MQALADIPLLLITTNQVLDIYRKSKELHCCSSALYVSVLAALEHIVAWYREKASSKHDE